MEKRFRVGTFDESINKVLGTSIEVQSIYQSKGLKAHMLKRRHYIAANYIDMIPDILANPDYVGRSGEEDDPSIEYVKCYNGHNIRLVVKSDSGNNNLYVATMFELPPKKLDRFIHSGRLKKLVDE